MKYSLLSIIFLFSMFCHSQIVIDNGYNVNIENGIYLNVEGYWNNNGVFISDSNSFVNMLGGQQIISGNSTTRFSNLIIDGYDTKTLGNLLTQKTEISKALIFNNQKLIINSNDLFLSSDAEVINASNQRFVVTNSTGSLVRIALTTGIDYLFPVGDAPNSYKPVVLTPQNLNDTFAVRILGQLIPFDPTAIQRTYVIKSAYPNLSYADINLGWNTTDEGLYFNSQQALMWQQQNGVLSPLLGVAGALPNNPSTDKKYIASNVMFISHSADSFTVKSSAPPVITTQPESVALCEYGEATFAIGGNFTTALSFQWQMNCSGIWQNIINGGNTPIISGAFDTVLVLTNVPYNLNACMIRCIAYNVLGSDTSNTVHLTIFPQPIAYISGNTMLCDGENAYLIAEGTGSSFIWSTNETTQHISFYPQPPSQIVSVTVTDDNFCVNDAQVNVSTTEHLYVELTSNFVPNQTIIGQTITFTAMPSYYENYAFLIDGDTVQFGGSHIFSTNTISNIAMVSVVASVNNCTAKDSIHIAVKPITNAFTPYDKNGKNDTFGKEAYLVIVNRWGQVLFEGYNGWNGLYNGKRVSPGTYFYTMLLNKGAEDEFVIKGSVMVVDNNK